MQDDSGDDAQQGSRALHQLCDPALPTPPKTSSCVQDGCQSRRPGATATASRRLQISTEGIPLQYRDALPEVQAGSREPCIGSLGGGRCLAPSILPLRPRGRQGLPEGASPQGQLGPARRGTHARKHPVPSFSFGPASLCSTFHNISTDGQLPFYGGRQAQQPTAQAAPAALVRVSSQRSHGCT